MTRGQATSRPHQETPQDEPPPPPAPNEARAPMTPPSPTQAGFTLLEILVVIAIVGILSGIAATNVSRLRQPADESARALNSVLAAGRARAISSTSAVRIQRLASQRAYDVSVAPSCAATAEAWLPLPALTYTVPTDVSITNATVDWTACFTSRGALSDTTTLPTVKFTDKYNRSRTVTVYGGGALEVK